MNRCSPAMLLAILAAPIGVCRGNAAAAMTMTLSSFSLMPRAAVQPHTAAEKQYQRPVLGFAQSFTLRPSGLDLLVPRSGMEVRTGERLGKRPMMHSPVEARGRGRLLAGPRLSLSTKDWSRRGAQRIPTGRWLCEGLGPRRGNGAPVVACHPEGDAGTDLDSEDLAKIIESIDSADWQAPITSSASSFILKAPYAPTGDQPRYTPNPETTLCLDTKTLGTCTESPKVRTVDPFTEMLNTHLPY